MDVRGNTQLSCTHYGKPLGDGSGSQSPVLCSSVVLSQNLSHFHKTTEWLRLPGPSVSLWSTPSPAEPPRAGCLGLLEIPREETSASGQPVPALSLCTMQKCSWYSEGSTALQFVLMASCPGTGHHLKEPSCILCAPSLWLCTDIDEIPHATSSPGWAAWAHSASPRGRDAPVPNHSNGPLLDALQYIQVSCTDVPRTEPSTPNVASPMLSRAHCWLMCNMVSTRAPGSFAAELTSSWVPGAVSPSCGSYQPTSPTCRGPSECQHDPVVNQQLLSVLCHLQIYWGCTRPHCLVG